ncbi:MAG: DUF937 domain-containing protein [Lachnospiraceae bacterium]|nr:DUF937 domain-containing protein [Lachnospiraceae bacterium]
MDINKLAGVLLGSDSINGLSNLTNVSGTDVNSVLAAALPALLNGANDQAKGKDTTESFANALAQHAKSDTKDVAGFLGNVDLADGAKIIGHLLGAQKTDVTESVAEETGVSNDKTEMILSAVGPLLMSLLGQQADEDENKGSGVEALLGALLENVDLVELLTGASSEGTGKKGSKKKSKKKAAKKEEDSSALGSIVNGLFKLLK